MVNDRWTGLREQTAEEYMKRHVRLKKKSKKRKNVIDS